MTTALISALIAVGISCTVAPLVLALLRRGNVLDHPSARSSHVEPIPRGGGVAPSMGALVALALTPSVSGSQRWTIAVAAVLFGLLGLVEDIVGIRPLHRLAIQFVFAAIAALFVLDHLAGSGLWIALLAAGVILWLVAFVNAYNFMDGIDGISVAQALGAGATWTFVGVQADSPVLATGGAIAAGAVLGFAPWNLPRARMFLGDVGSYFFGAWLGTVAVLGLRSGVPAEAVLAPLALYAADTGATLARRVARGERWYLPHRDHVYQRLVEAGWTHIQTSAFVAAGVGACGALGQVSLGGSLPARIIADIAIGGVIGIYLCSPRWHRTRGSVGFAASRRKEHTKNIS